MLIPEKILNLLSFRSIAGIDSVIIHHSVAPKTLDISQIATMEETSQGFLCVGYNAYTKCLDEEKDIWAVQQGRPLNRLPAAAYGMNTNSYDICLGGNYHPGGASFLDEVSPNALHAIAAQVMAVKAKCPNLKYLIGHRDVATIEGKRGNDPSEFATACPGDRLYAKMHDLRVATGLATYPGLG